MNTVRTLSRLALATAAATLGLAAHAQTYTEWGAITQLEGGWADNTMSIRHAAPLVTGGCPVTGAGYATLPSDPGANLYHTMLLGAFLNRKEVALLINGCAYGKPRVIAVSVR